jgi:chemotaxis-related protein WspD
MMLGKKITVHKSKGSLAPFKQNEDHFVEKLLQRPITKDYQEEWTDVLMKYQEMLEAEKVISVVIFRLSKEWLALPTIFFKEVIQHRPIHHIPHRTGKILLGVVNLEGVLRLCIDLQHLLQITPCFVPCSLRGFHQSDRMIAIQKEGELWVFLADEIEGIDVWDLSLIENVPINMTKSAANYLKGMMNKGNKRVGLLDEELLFYSLMRNLT